MLPIGLSKTFPTHRSTESCGWIERRFRGGRRGRLLDSRIELANVAVDGQGAGTGYGRGGPDEFASGTVDELVALEVVQGERGGGEVGLGIAVL